MRSSASSILVLTSVLFLTPPANRADTVLVEAGTIVPAELAENVNSAFNTQGQTVYLRVSEDIKVGGRIAIRKGALVEAQIGSVAEAGMVGKSGSVAFHPIRVAGVDGQWLAVDPTNFGGEGKGAGAGMIVAIGLFAKGKPGFVLRGTEYRVTIRRDTEVDPDVFLSPLVLDESNVTLAGQVRPVRFVRFSRSRAGNDIETELKLTPEIAPLVTTESSATKVVSMMDQVLLTPVKSKTVRIDSKKNLLIATFDWWSIIRYAQSGSTPLTLQSDLSDGRIAQAKLTMESEWKLD